MKKQIIVGLALLASASAASAQNFDFSSWVYVQGDISPWNLISARIPVKGDMIKPTFEDECHTVTGVVLKDIAGTAVNAATRLYATPAHPCSQQPQSYQQVGEPIGEPVWGD